MLTAVPASTDAHAGGRARRAPARRPSARVARALLACFVAFLAPAVSHAQWPHEPGTDVPVSTAPGDQRVPRIVPDGSGGAFITWYDYRTNDYDVYVQRVDARGRAMWTVDGKLVCTATGTQRRPELLADGAGGVFVAWEDYRNGTGDLYAQRFDGSGAPLWAANGVPVAVLAETQREVCMVPDGAGGVILAWEDSRSLTSLDIYAQRLDASGAAMWAVNGVALCTSANAQYRPQLVTDGAGGAIVTWEDYRSGTSYDIYARRVDASGVPQWTADGVVVCNAADDQYSPRIASDGLGGAVVTWSDWRAGWETDVYAQRISALGYAQWTTNGLVICNAVGHQVSPVIVPDGNGGAILAWFDQRGAIGYAPYAQRVSMGGSVVWPVNGVGVGGATPYGDLPLLVSDGAGGAIVAWKDGRSGTNGELYAQRVSAAGACLWPSSNPPVSWAPRPIDPVATSDGNGGAIFAWQDMRSGLSPDLYAKRVDRHGYLGSAEAAIAGVRDVPNDQGGKVKLSWSASWLDADPAYGVAEYRVFRSAPSSLASLESAALLSRAVTEDSDAAVREGSLLALAAADGAVTYWEYVGTQAAEGLAAYSMVTATTSDSVAGSNPVTHFMVEARANTSVSSARWYSAPDSGYSVDNLAPAQPSPFTGAYQGGVTFLHWERNSEADLAGYRLYRGTSASFTPSEANLVATPADTGWADAGGLPYVYKLTAVDAHGNESPAATLAPGGTLDVPGTADAELAFAPVAPQPVRSDAALRFSLAQPGPVRIEVFDVTGRRVAVPVDGAFASGSHSVRWRASGDDGRSLAAGVYHARLSAAGRVVTRRIVVAR